MPRRPRTATRVRAQRSRNRPRAAAGTPRGEGRGAAARVSASCPLAGTAKGLTSGRLWAEVLKAQGLAGEGLGHRLLHGCEGQGLGPPRADGRPPEVSQLAPHDGTQVPPLVLEVHKVAAAVAQRVHGLQDAAPHAVPAGRLGLQQPRAKQQLVVLADLGHQDLRLLRAEVGLPLLSPRGTGPRQPAVEAAGGVLPRASRGW